MGYTFLKISLLSLHFLNFGRDEFYMCKFPEIDTLFICCSFSYSMIRFINSIQDGSVLIVDYAKKETLNFKYGRSHRKYCQAYRNSYRMLQDFFVLLFFSAKNKYKTRKKCNSYNMDFTKENPTTRVRLDLSSIACIFYVKVLWYFLVKFLFVKVLFK